MLWKRDPLLFRLFQAQGRLGSWRGRSYSSNYFSHCWRFTRCIFQQSLLQLHTLAKEHLNRIRKTWMEEEEAATVPALLIIESLCGSSRFADHRYSIGAPLDLQWRFQSFHWCTRAYSDKSQRSSDFDKPDDLHTRVCSVFAWTRDKFKACLARGHVLLRNPSVVVHLDGFDRSFSKQRDLCVNSNLSNYWGNHEHISEHFPAFFVFCASRLYYWTSHFDIIFAGCFCTFAVTNNS